MIQGGLGSVSRVDGNQGPEAVRFSPLCTFVYCCPGGVFCLTVTLRGASLVTLAGCLKRLPWRWAAEYAAYVHPAACANYRMSSTCACFCLAQTALGMRGARNGVEDGGGRAGGGFGGCCGWAVHTAVVAGLAGNAGCCVWSSTWQPSVTLRLVCAADAY